MRAKNLHIALMNLITGLISVQLCYAQQWGGEKPTGLLTSWTVNVSGGYLSYFGDLSLHDFDVAAKLEKESGGAASVILTKNIFRDAVGISGQIVGGNLKGAKGDISFTAKLIEYNLQIRIDFVDLLMYNRSHDFGVTGSAGVGQFLFSNEKVVNSEGKVDNFKHKARVPEFVFFFGGGLYYKLTDHFGITAELALRQCQNDRLDDYVKNDDFDYYSYLSIGISYDIKNFHRAPLRNKARLANRAFRFDSPANSGRL